jgi:hypothetical protein
MRKVSLFSAGNGLLRFSILAVALLLTGITAFAQVTSSTISGIITDKSGEGLAGATVVAIHTPSGSRYGTSSNASGRYTLPAVRVGGPFSVTVSYTGYEPQTIEGVMTNLGTTSNVDFQLAESGISLGEVDIVADRNSLFSSQRTGAASTFDVKRVTSVPAIGSRSISSLTKYNPNGNGRSFGGQDSRLNNFTIDGSVFNNGFGLGSDAQAGGRTGSTAISLDAIQELQVNVAPFDVRQTGFVGAGINAVTRSGTNEFSGSAYYNTRAANMYGNKARDVSVTATQFNENVVGARIGGPIVKNKVFFFVNAEMVKNTSPATPWVAAGSTNTGTATRVLKSDLETVSSLLKEKFGYETGPYEAYNNATESKKFLARLDFNLSDQHKLNLRYTHHDSKADVNISNSASLGFGNRTTNINSMSYQNSGYIIGDNTRSIVAELNSTFSDKIANSFSAGYDLQNEDRQYKGALFPTIDILKDNATYIAAGFDPFTPDNLLDYSTFHITNNVSYYAGKHTITAGVNYENYKSNNSFFPGSNGVYVFNSLDEFKAAINGDSTGVKRFQYRYSALEGGADPLQVLKVSKYDVYGQDEFKVNKNFTVTAGVRVSLIDLGATKSLQNTVLADSTFRNVDGAPLKINTSTIPEPQLLFEPRLGFNYNVAGKSKTQIRGGAGIFTGRPPYVWLSNQIGNNGVLTGFIDASNTNTTKYPLVGDATQFIPATPTLPSTFEIAITDAAYRFPQVIKTNLAIDQKLPGNIVATVEFLYNQNLNAAYYYNANQEASTANFSGPDTRPRFPGSLVPSAQLNNAVRVVNNVSSAAVLATTNKGYYAGATFKLEYPERKGLYAMAAYTYSQTKDLMNAGSIASGSFTGARSVNGNNKLDLTNSDQDIPHRIIGLTSYSTSFGNKNGGAVQFSLGYEGLQSRNLGFGGFSYTYNGDMNGDGIAGNDLLFVPTNAADLTFEDIKDANGNVTTSAAQQVTLFDEYIKQDAYLDGRRGQYTERNGAILPWLHRFDLAVSRDFWIKTGKGQKRNNLQFRVDIFNVGNLLNSDWGVGRRFVATAPLQYRSVTAEGVPVYRVASQLLNTATKKTIDYNSSINDVWNLQLGIRYSFN